jgi:hypothetical protein
VVIEWADRRCIVCTESTALTKAHVIPAAVGGRLSVAFECGPCNSRLGHAIEAPLKNDASIRFAIETLDDRLAYRRSRTHPRELYAATDSELAVRAVREAGNYRVLDTPQADGSLVKDTARAREDLATTLRRRGAGSEEIQAALRSLAAADVGDRVELGRGVAARKGSVQSFTPDLSRSGTVPDACVLAIAYRFLALVAGTGIYAAALDPIRTALLGSADQSGWETTWLLARRPHEPWHGLALTQLRPRAVVHVRLFGQLAWDVAFTGIAFGTKPAVSTYEIRLDGEGREAFG